MSNIGLFYVGAVLIVNGVMLLGLMTPRAAAPLNLFVGALQVFTPTYLVMAAGNDPEVIPSVAGLYLFGFTYLWVGINALAGLPNTGLGWFSLFVAVAAVAFAADSWRSDAYVFAVIWMFWSLLWLLFFLVLGLEWSHLARFTGGVAIAEGVLTASVPAWLGFFGELEETMGVALVGAGLGVALAVGIAAVTKPRR